MQQRRADYDRTGLLEHIERQFKVAWRGVHGIDHWLRVQHYASRVGMRRGADPLVMELFALLHDSCRESERHDPLHGERGAELAYALNGTFFSLSGHRIDLLCTAIYFHSDGLTHSDVTIQSCWDGDRMDLGRVGIQPNPKFLSKQAADLLDELIPQSMNLHQ